MCRPILLVVNISNVVIVERFGNKPMTTKEIISRIEENIKRSKEIPLDGNLRDYNSSKLLERFRANMELLADQLKSEFEEKDGVGHLNL